MPNLVSLTRNSLQILAILAGFFVNALTAGESLFQRFFQIHRKMPSSEFIVICVCLKKSLLLILPQKIPKSLDQLFTRERMVSSNSLAVTSWESTSLTLINTDYVSMPIEKNLFCERAGVCNFNLRYFMQKINIYNDKSISFVFTICSLYFFISYHFKNYP